MTSTGVKVSDGHAVESNRMLKECCAHRMGRAFGLAGERGSTFSLVCNQGVGAVGLKSPALPRPERVFSILPGSFRFPVNNLLYITNFDTNLTIRCLDTGQTESVKWKILARN